MTITHSRMTAIVTRYLGPTNTKGGRIVADAGMGRKLIIPYAHKAPTTDEAHAVAAQALCDKMGWTGDLRSGGWENGFIFIFVDK